MKKVSKRVIKNAFYLVLVVVFYSCVHKRVPVANYKGGIIYKKQNKLGDLYFDIKRDSLFKTIRVYKLDYDLYKIGDTIK